MESLHCSLATMIIRWTLPCWKTKLLCSLLGELRDGILAVGLGEGVGKAVLNDKTFEMLRLMFCWPFLGPVVHEAVVQLNCAMLMLM